MIEETWKSLEGVVEHGANYEVSTLGNVRRKKSGANLKPVLTYNGYGRVTLRRKLYTVHRLAALAFLPNPEGKTQVNHISGVKTDNRLINLEWCSPSDNLKHAFSSGLKDNTNKKAVNQFDVNNNLLATYESLSEAERQTGICLGTIYYQCRNQSVSRFLNYHFRFVGE